MRLQNLLGAACAAVTLCAASLASAVIPESEQATAVEFYHKALDHYFITAEPAEINDLDSGKHVGWTRTGYRFAVIKAGSTYEGSTPICRFYSQTLDSHFYSANATECENVKTNPELSAVWQFEASEVYRAFPVDAATGACPADTTATYRLWNKRADANHRYTDQLANFFYMVSKGYQPEGNGNPDRPVVFCTPAGGDVVPPLPEGAPSCAVSASSGAPALGATLTLTAQCSNSPLYYLWQNCNSTTDTCTTTRSTAGSVPYTMYAANAVAPAEPVTINVNWGGGGGGGGAVPVCQLTANNANPQVGSNLVMTANCSQTPTSWEWVECNYLQAAVCNAIPSCPTTSKTCTVTTSVSGYHRYMVSATNGAGKGTRVQLELEWAGSGNPNPPGGGGNPPVAAPVCSLFTSDVNPAVGTSINITASCSNGPTRYNWGNASGCSTTYFRCTVTATNPGTITYSVSGTNNGGTGGTAYVDVVWRNAAPQFPNCTLAPANANPFVGTNVTLTATCTNSDASTAYAWTGCTPANGTSSTCTANEAAPGGKVYSVVATNTVGASQPANAAITWHAAVPPTCTATATPSSTPFTGTSITITASCSPSATSYTWTGCTSTSASCVDTQTVAGAKTYTVKGTNAYGDGAEFPVVVTWTAPPPVPPVCTISPLTTTATVGQSVTLTANCTNLPTSYQWTNCTSSTATCNASAAQAGPVTYTVVAGNQYGFSNGAQAQINWQANNPPGGGTMIPGWGTGWMLTSAMQVRSYQALQDVQVSSSVGPSGSALVWGHVSNSPVTTPSFPLDSSVTSQGRGHNGRKMLVKAGQWYNTYFEPEGGVEMMNMRVTAE